MGDRVLSIDLAWQMDRQAIMVAIAAELDAAYDLKNQRVRELEKRFDKIDRQIMQLQRREALCRMRKKVK